MPSFEIVSAERFPDHTVGYIAADNGVDIRLNDSVSYLFGTNSTVLGLFMSEYTARLQIPMIEEYATATDLGITLGGIITFGVHMDSDKLGTTHFETVARELELPLLRLAKPPQYPDYDQKNQEPFIKEWLMGNPLVDLYFKAVQVDIGGNTATITPFEP